MPHLARTGRRRSRRRVGFESGPLTGTLGARAAPCDAKARVTARVLELLTSSHSRKGSLQQCDYPKLVVAMRASLERSVRAGAPVGLTLMAFPFKVPNPAKVGGRMLPDFAELAAIRRLSALAGRIRAFYPPGLQVELIHDGALIAPAFGVTQEEVRAYERYFAGLLARADEGGAIRPHDFEQLQGKAGLRPEPVIDRFRDEAIQWWRTARGTPSWRERFGKTLGMLNLRDLPAAEAAGMLAAGRDGALPSEFGEVEQRVHQAMIAYHALDTLIHRLDPRPLLFPDAIHATTRVQPRRLALWLVRRGNGLLPWHGVGTLDGEGRAGVAIAERVMSRPDMSPLTLPAETTPFCYIAAGSAADP